MKKENFTEKIPIGANERTSKYLINTLTAILLFNLS